MNTFYTDDIDKLYTEIAGSIKQNFTDFLEGINAPDLLKKLYFDVELNQKRYKINLISNSIKDRYLGIFQLGMKEATIQTTGGIIQWEKQDINSVENIEVNRFICFNLQYKYSHHGGGTNGCCLFLPNEEEPYIYYCIQTKQFLTYSEYIKILRNEN